MSGQDNRSNLLEKILGSDIKTLICDHVPETLSILQQEAASDVKQTKTVALRWSKLPQVGSIIDDTLSCLASIAYHTWPSWYGGDSRFESDPESFVEETVQNLLGVSEILGHRRRISSAWLKAAVKSCRAGRIPVPNGFTPEVQVLQLALAIEPHDLLFILAVEDQAPLENSMFSLARASEWLAKETGAHVAVLIPRLLASSNELDSITYDSLLSVREDYGVADDTGDDELKHVVWPIEGSPHPFSPGEKELAKRLSQDSELNSLFSFNQRIETVRGSSFLVDLVWMEGRIVVEIDGYRYHSNQYSFRLDRHRDYELTITGYLTLRIPHDEVMRDPELAIDKIRDFVAFRRGQK